MSTLSWDSIVTPSLNEETEEALQSSQTTAPRPHRDQVLGPPDRIHVAVETKCIECLK